MISALSIGMMVGGIAKNAKMQASSPASYISHDTGDPTDEVSLFLACRLSDDTI